MAPLVAKTAPDEVSRARTGGCVRGARGSRARRFIDLKSAERARCGRRARAHRVGLVGFREVDSRAVRRGVSAIERAR